MTVPVLIACGLAVLAGLAGHALAWRRRHFAWLGLAAMLLVATGWLWYAGSQATGWDGIGYAIVMMLGTGPLLLGLLLGAAIAGLRVWRAARRAG